MDMDQILTEYPKCFSPETMAIPWFDSPFFDHLLEKTELSAFEREQILKFARDGYLVFDTEIPETILDGVIRDLHGTYPGEDGLKGRLQDVWQRSENVKLIATNERIRQLLQLLYRREAVPFQTLNFGVGTQQRTHSDTVHFQSHPANWMCGVWVALEDVDSENGPLHYYPGSHKLSLFDMDNIDLHADYSAYPSYEDFVEALFSTGKYEKHEVKMKKGQGLIWAANLFHGGSPIKDPTRTRHSQVTHYYFSGAAYYTPMISDVFLGRIYFRTDNFRDIRTGQPIPHFYKGQPFQPKTRVGGHLMPKRYDAKTLEALQTKGIVRSKSRQLLSRVRRSVVAGRDGWKQTK